MWSIRRARAKTCCVEENCCYDVFWWNLRVCTWNTSSSHTLGMLFCMHRHCRKEQPPQRPCKKWKSIIIFLIEFHYIRSSLHNKFDLKSNADKYWSHKVQVGWDGKPISQSWLERWHFSPMNFPNQLIHNNINFHIWTRRQPECVIYPPTDDVQGVKEGQPDQQLKSKMSCCKPTEKQRKNNWKEKCHVASQLKSNWKETENQLKTNWKPTEKQMKKMPCRKTTEKQLTEKQL